MGLRQQVSELRSADAPLIAYMGDKLHLKMLTTVLFSMYTSKDERISSTERHQPKEWTNEDNQNVLHSYSKSGDRTQRRYRKRMIEIWTEPKGFNSTSQNLADQNRIILKKN